MFQSQRNQSSLFVKKKLHDLSTPLNNIQQNPGTSVPEDILLIQEYKRQNNVNFHIVTVATESKYYFPYLVESCRKNGKNLEILGMGEKWEGLNSKLLKMINYLKKIPSSDIVCFVDGYDVICCQNLNNIVNVFLEIKKKTGCKIIVGHDKTSFLMSFNYLYFGKCNNISINSGTYIGYSSDLLKILKNIYKLNPKNNINDQLLMTKYCNENNDIYSDTESKLFLSLLYPLEELDKYITIDKNKNIFYKSNKPFFIHAPGNSYLDNIIYKLGYSIEPNKINKELYNNFYQKVLEYIIFYIKENYTILLFILCIIIITIFLLNKFKYKKLKFKKKY